MATKQEWLDYLKLEAKWVKEMTKWVKKQEDGEINTDITTQDAGGDNPPVKPPNP